MVPNGWNSKLLGDITIFSQGLQVPIDKQYEVSSTDACRFLRISDFVNPNEIPRYIDTPDKKFMVNQEDLSMIRYGSAGAGDVVRGLIGAIANNLFRIIPNESLVLKEYLWIYLRQEKIKDFLFSGASSSTMPAVSFKLVGKVPLILPPLPEQRKIAAILGTWDKAISTTERLIDNSKQQKKALMQQLLTGKKRLLDDSGRPFEGEWEKVKLGDISNITTGSSNREDSTLVGEYAFFDRSVDVRTSSQFLFDGEAIIVPGEGQEFIPKYFNGKFDLHQRTYAIMNLLNSDGKFLYYSLSYFSYYLLSQAVGSTVKSLRLPMFQKMPIQLPSKIEQQKIAFVLTNADKEIDLLEQQLADLKQEKKALMQQLLTGKRRVEVNDEAVA